MWKTEQKAKCVPHWDYLKTSLITVYSEDDKQMYHPPLIEVIHHTSLYEYYIHKNNVKYCTICLYIQTRCLFTELGTMDIQTYPYMEESYL